MCIREIIYCTACDHTETLKWVYCPSYLGLTTSTTFHPSPLAINEEMRTTVSGSFNPETCPNPECPSKKEAREEETKEAKDKIIEKQPEGHKSNEEEHGKGTEA
ncbi:hypothetical protein NW761_002899 [Fusarium oxysporum]|uniref:Uncharacterized protein n=1 Tax=Fusarium oxysporum f. sp. pisi HDV247 TaxID=1080344 RepID=W9PD78_FUSOX|nr:hypothetical protein FOVG_08163 [Fusarium oxysporum f. sp. pisi HDV247]KAJ4057496.1 hypothetical protein NW758_001918 [Fusarium oxysporum]WKT41370.1 hypothetical protein QSH57_006176 [Fusarium oxysporum f. sp. vasinfectum]KAJ4069951.1 hypothetical protein NW753_000829 [Fusarium oxysporum]KAJ4071270.1 hypothetical protein NW763_000287 [Fusarium oxysporum]